MKHPIWQNGGLIDAHLLCENTRTSENLRRLLRAYILSPGDLQQQALLVIAGCWLGEIQDE
jgi:hypothetical protein